jgi:uncharacterized membrane protein YbhN (UPF0104 family)
MRVGFLIGLGIVILLVAWQGVATIAGRLAAAGWGILLVSLFIPPDLMLGIAGFVLVQWAGAFGIIARPAARMSSSGRWQSLIESAADLDAVIRDLYRRPGVIVMSTCLRLAKRVVMGGEVWLVAWLVGYPIGLEEAVMLNSLAIALRSAAFVVPGGIGVQEGGYVVVGALVGLPADVMLTISLATRLGELIEGLPGLLAWQFAEGGAYWRRRRQADAPPR